MDRRTFVCAFAAGLLASPHIAKAQQAAKLPVVGVLITNAASGMTLRTFVQGLHDLGYIDGKNIIIEIRSAGGKAGALPGLAAELVQHNVDVIFATGPAGVPAARDATSVTPIVAMDLETDPVQAGGFAASPARAVTLRACSSIFLAWLESGWSCSEKRRREFVALACSGIRRPARRN